VAIGTYAELQTAVGAWLHRADLTSQIPDFITLAEHRMARDLRIAPLVTTGTLTIGAAAASVTLSTLTGLIEVVAAKISTSRLTYVTPDQYDQALLNANSVVIPIYYTIIGTTFYVAPSWTAGGSVTVTYVKKETALSGSSTTNWYILNAPDMLLYACLLEAAPYLKDTADAGTWRTYYEYARDRLNDQYGVVDSYTRMMNFQKGEAKSLRPAI
jgi:hypothetical protein